MKLSMIFTEDDKFLRGIIAGLIAGLAKDIPSIVADFFINPFPSYWDYAGLVGFGVEPNTFFEYFYAILIELGFSAAIGVIIVYINGIIPSKHFLIKGAFLGASVWLSISGLVFFTQIPQLSKPHIAATIINSLTSIGYGMLLTVIDRYLASKNKNHSKDRS